MAGTNDDLNMDMIKLDGFTFPEDLEEITQEQVKEIGVADEGDVSQSQEIVGDGTEESFSDEEAGTSPANSDDDNVLKSFAGFLAERGILSVPQERIDSVKDEDTLVDLVKEQIKQNEFKDLTDIQKKYLEALRLGIPEKAIHEHLVSTQAYEQLTDDVLHSSAEIRKDLIVQGMTSTGMEESYAVKHYNRVSASNEDFEEAKLWREKLKQSRDAEYDNAVITEQNRQKSLKEEEVKQLEAIKKSVYDETLLLNSVPLTQGIKDKVYKLMTNPVEITKDGRPLNALMKHQKDNPIEFNKVLYFLYDATNGFTDLSKLTTKAASKAVNSFKAKLQKSTFINDSTGNPSAFSNHVEDVPHIITDII